MQAPMTTRPIQAVTVADAWLAVFWSGRLAHSSEMASPAARACSKAELPEVLDLGQLQDEQHVLAAGQGFAAILHFAVRSVAAVTGSVIKAGLFETRASQATTVANATGSPVRQRIVTGPALPSIEPKPCRLKGDL